MPPKERRHPATLAATIIWVPALSGALSPRRARRQSTLFTSNYRSEKALHRPGFLPNQRAARETNIFVMSGSVSAPTGIFVVQDHAFVREALKVLLNKEADLSVVGEADNTRDAMRFLTTTQASVGIVLVEITLKGRSGLELIKDMKAHRINIPALVLTMCDESLYAERSLRAGARGYIKKDSTFENIKSAIRTVLRGEIYLHPKIASKILDGLYCSKDVKGIAQLTDRELEIFRLIGCGVTTSEIAAQLSLGISTIETYRARIKTKLRLRNASWLSYEAVRWALQLEAPALPNSLVYAGSH